MNQPKTVSLINRQNRKINLPDRGLTTNAAARAPKILAMLIVFAVVIVGGCGKQEKLSEAVGKLTFKTLTGEQISVTDSKGPLLINFWATDCVVCIREMPEIATLYNKYQSTEFELIAVAMPYDPPNLVLEMAEQEQWPFPVALDLHSEALTAFATIKGTPTSYLLDRDGRLVKRYVGAIPIKLLEKQLDILLDLG